MAKKDDGEATGKEVLSPADRLARNNEIVTGRMRGLSYGKLAETYGLSKARIIQIHNEWKLENPSLRTQDAMDIFDHQLGGYEADIEELVIVAATTAQDSVRVNAIGRRAEIRSKITDLLQQAGVLPRDLGQISVQIDARITANRILGVLRQHDVSVEVCEAMIEALQDGGALIEGEATEVE